MGCIHIYYGDGKGKTTAAIGLAVRAAGCGFHSVVVRFLKQDASGEVEALGRFPEIRVLPCKKNFGFTWQMSKEEKKEAAVCYREMMREAFEKACCLIAGQGGPENGADAVPVLLIMDEVCAALNAGLLELSEVLELLDGRPAALEVILTGRNPSPELLCRADYVTEMRKVSHPFERGLGARRGIEY